MSAPGREPQGGVLPGITPPTVRKDDRAFLLENQRRGNRVSVLETPQGCPCHFFQKQTEFQDSQLQACAGAACSFKEQTPQVVERASPSGWGWEGQGSRGPTAPPTPLLFMSGVPCKSSIARGPRWTSPVVCISLSVLPPPTWFWNG